MSNQPPHDGDDQTPHTDGTHRVIDVSGNSDDPDTTPPTDDSGADPPRQSGAQSQRQTGPTGDDTIGLTGLTHEQLAEEGKKQARIEMQNAANGGNVTPEAAQEALENITEKARSLSEEYQQTRAKLQRTVAQWHNLRDTIERLEEIKGEDRDRHITREWEGGIKIQIFPDEVPDTIDSLLERHASLTERIRQMEQSTLPKKDRGRMKATVAANVVQETYENISVADAGADGGGRSQSGQRAQPQRTPSERNRTGSESNPPMGEGNDPLGLGQDDLP